MTNHYSVAYQISARTAGGRPDWRKNFLACSPENRQKSLDDSKRRIQQTTFSSAGLPETYPRMGARLSNCLSCLPLSSGVMAHTLAPPGQNQEMHDVLYMLEFFLYNLLKVVCRLIAFTELKNNKKRPLLL